MARRRRHPRDEYSDYYEETPSPQNRPSREPGQKRQLPSGTIHLTILLVFGLAFLALIWLVAGKPMLESTLKKLVAPVGLIWMGLFLALYFSLLRRQGLPAFLAFACWILLTVCGNSLVCSWLAHSLQSQFAEADFSQLEKLDVVLVLGGGQTTTPKGQAQVAISGDRALMAARLVLENKADRIICAGTSSLPLAGSEMTQADALEQVLLSLQVPPGKILKIGGSNTLEEIQAFDKWITQNNGGRLRKGIVTSAWHLPRAMRLAESVGVDAVPLPSDFANVRHKRTPALLIPDATNLFRVTAYLKEHLAGLTGR